MMLLLLAILMQSWKGIYRLKEAMWRRLLEVEVA
jgi:hypothetical protein